MLSIGCWGGVRRGQHEGPGKKHETSVLAYLDSRGSREEQDEELTSTGQKDGTEVLLLQSAV